MANLVNRLLLFLCSAVFSAVESVYRLFYGLATTRLFGEEIVQDISNRIYILVSIVILFAFAIKLIEAIVNPDLLTDNKKGVTGVLKRTIIGLLLIVAIPNMFNLVYYIQREIISTNLIEKIVFDRTEESTDTNNTSGILTSSIIRGFVYPIDENGIEINEKYLCGDKEDCNFANELAAKSPTYQKYVTIAGSSPNYDDLADIQVSAEWENGADMYSISALMLLLVGIYVLYQVILMSFDAALRLVNLGILEIMAPLIIVTYIGGGTDYLTKWAKMVGSKFASIFVRIAALAFMAVGLQLLFDPNSVLQSDSISFYFKLLIIIGLLRLVKDLPDIFSKIFGVDVKGPNGIRGRLGEMAGIGQFTQNAWDRVSHGIRQTAGHMVRHPLAAPAAVTSAVGSTIARSIAGGRAAFRQSGARGHHGVVRGLATLRGTAFRTIGSLPTAVRSARAGWTNSNLRSIGGAAAQVRDANPEHGTFIGRTRDVITQGLGFGTAQERYNARPPQYTMFRDNEVGSATEGLYFATREAALAAGVNVAHLTQETLSQRQFEEQQTRISRVQSSADHANETVANHVDGANYAGAGTITNGAISFTGNVSQLNNQLQHYIANSAPRPEDFRNVNSGVIDQRRYSAAVTAFETGVQSLRDQIATIRNQQITNETNAIINGTFAGPANVASSVLTDINQINQVLGTEPIRRIGAIGNFNDLHDIRGFTATQSAALTSTESNRQQQLFDEAHSPVGVRRAENDSSSRVRSNRDGYTNNTNNNPNNNGGGH